jgi:hypothetical protein
MKRFLWSRSDFNGDLDPYVILECNDETAEEIYYRARRNDYEGMWGFIAKRLHEKYPKDFPSWWDDYNRRRLFWYNNVLEDYGRARKRMISEKMEELRDNYDNEESLREDAEWKVDEELEDLEVYAF